MTTFETDLAKLCSIELRLSLGNPERAGALVQSLVSTLALTIAVVSKGDSAAMNTMLEGASSFLFEETASRAKIGKFIGGRESPATSAGRSRSP